MPDPDDGLLEIALQIADSTPVDWASSGAAAGDVAAIRKLKRLEGLVRAFGAGTVGEAGFAAAVAPGPDTRPVLFHWGPLRVHEKLGEGGFAEVFRASDPRLQRDVALKLRHPSSGAGRHEELRWLDEARRLARVNHPNVLSVYGADVHDGRAGIWTELITGKTLEEWLTDQGPLGPREAALLGIDLCGALAAVHAAGLVHGDLKTRNVMRTGSGVAAAGSGRLVLMDFDAASERSAARAVTTGTPMILAPEVLHGGAATPASDIYSLGVLLYRMLTGRYPVEAASLAELSARLGRGEQRPLRAARPDLPADLVRVVEQALQVEPARRIPDAAAMERQLTATLTGAEAGTPARSGAIRGRSAWLVAIVALAVAGALFVSRPRAPAAPLQVEAVLFRRDDRVARPLSSGDRVAPGDHLYLETSSPEPTYVYVFNEDASRSVHVLFPLAASETANPLPAGVANRLPGRHGPGDLDWLVTSAEGSETFLILASRRPVAAVDSVLATVPVAADGATVQYARLRPEDLTTLRGVAEVVPGSRPVTAEPGLLVTLSRQLESSPGRRDLWIRVVTLENPAP